MRRSWSVVLLSVTIGLVACGSDDPGSSAAGGSESDTSLRAAPTTVEGQGAPATDAPVDTASPDPAGSDDEGTDGAAAGGEFCARAEAFEAADPLSDIFTTEDPAVIEAQWDTFESLMNDLVDAAPADISADFQTVAASFGLVREAYERADWDLLAVYDVVDADPELAAAFEGTDPEMEAAGARIDTYLDEVCGIAEE